jgi:hypothetical protein
MTTLMKTNEEIQAMEKATIINGVDNPNLLSVDSTEPLPTTVDTTEDEDAQKKEEEKKVENKDESKASDKKGEGDDTPKPPDEKSAEGKDADDEKVPKGVQERINKAIKKQRRAERERDFERNRRLSLEKEVEELRGKSAASPAKAVEKPKREDYIDEEAYQDAVIDWRVQEALKAKTPEQPAKKVEDAGTEKDKDKTLILDYAEELDTVFDKGREKFEDFDKVVLKNKEVSITEDMAVAMLDSDIADELMYFVASHADIAEELAELPVPRMAKRLVKIESELLGKKEKTPPVKEKQVSKAPSPISPVKASGASGKSPEEMTPSEYRAWRESQKK